MKILLSVFLSLYALLIWGLDVFCLCVFSILCLFVFRLHLENSVFFCLFCLDVIIGAEIFRCGIFRPDFERTNLGLGSPLSHLVQPGRGIAKGNYIPLSLRGNCPCLLLPCLVLSFLCRVSFCLVLSCLALFPCLSGNCPCLLLPCLVFSCCVSFCLALPCLVLSCLALFSYINN